MFKPTVNKIAVLFVILSSVPFVCVCQHIGIDTEEIEALVREWDFANNTRSVESFRNVYDDTLLFYTQTLPESKAIALKEKLFNQKPYFRQRISTGITYTPFTSGVTRCDFTKEVLERSGWRRFPSYLLVSYHAARYWIVGESDYATDKTLRYKLELGQPMTFENVSDASQPGFNDSLLRVSTIEDSSLTRNPTSHTGAVMEALETLLESIDPLVIFPELSRMGMVTIPKGYLFILVGILAMGALMIFIADSARSVKKKTGTVLQKQDDADRVIADFKMQSVFEAFVITLFDPLYFRHWRPKAERVLAGNSSERETGPDLEFDFNYKETHARFAIKCHYYKEILTREIRLFSPRRLQVLRDFAEGREAPLYYILGFGGTPDDPKELFLVPAKAMKHEFVTKAALKPYSKSGMFFYNSNQSRLQ